MIPYKTTISEAADSIDLTTLATVKSELGITNGASDTELARLITQASQTIATYCNRVFAKEIVVDHFRLQNECRSTDKLMLSRFPVGAISSVVEDGDALTADDYEVDQKTGFLWRLSSDEHTAWAQAKVLVTYAGGYELLDELPTDIERAAIVLVKQAWFGKSRDPMVKGEEVPGVLRTDYWVGATPGDNGALPAEVEGLIGPYRIISI